MIQRTHKGAKIKPRDHQPSFTPWVGTETIATIEYDGRVAVTYPTREGATISEFPCVGLVYAATGVKEHDILRLPLTDWDDLVAQVERLRREAGA